MFKEKTILAVIPARGGSKGVPGKNIKNAGGKPLIAWVIESAIASSLLDRVILSSDDAEIIDVAKKYGCEAPFVRPGKLATDESLPSDVVLHALEKIPGYDYIMLLQPTSPFTEACDIDGCIKFAVDNCCRSVVSVTRPDKSPFWMFKMGEKNLLEPIMGSKFLNCRRQDLPETFVPTGAVYLAQSKWFLENRSFYSEKTSGYIIPADRSLDIDTEFDFKLLEAMHKNV
jgi:N-acylneuraminate cytidylyltransferase